MKKQLLSFGALALLIVLGLSFALSRLSELQGKAHDHAQRAQMVEAGLLR